MNAEHTVGIVLARTNYGEADRIITVLTPDRGKLKLMAKGVRKQGSKLAGGIELLSVSEISYIPSRKEISTLISSRIETHFGEIVKNIERTMYAYELLKMFNRLTEDMPDETYFSILRSLLAALGQPEIRLDYIDFWGKLKLLEHSGHAPNLAADVQGQPLRETQTYLFDIDHMALLPHDHGDLDARHIKLLKLTPRLTSPETLQRIEGVHTVLPTLHQLTVTIAKAHL